MSEETITASAVNPDVIGQAGQPRVYSSVLAAGLSIVPGLGHLYAGKMGKAAAFLLISAGLLAGAYLARGSEKGLLLLVPYLLVMVPAAFESYCLASGKSGGLTESKSYIVALLLTNGLSVLPLLWQSSLFTKKSKVIWSVVVPALAVLYLGFIFVYGRTVLNLILELRDKVAGPLL